MSTVTFGNEPTPPVAPTPEALAAERPAWLPEQFNAPEDLVKSYQELRSKMDGKKPEGEQPKPEGEHPKPEGEQKEDKPDAEKTDAEKLHDAANRVLADVGLDLKAYNEEFSRDGKLSDDTYAALEGKGFDRATVDAYVKAMNAPAEQAKAIADAEIASIKEAVGGEEKFQTMLSWASQNLSDDEKASYDAMIESGDAKSARLAVEWLAGKFAASDSNEPTLLKGSVPSVPAVAPFRSMQEVTRAMADERYKKGDPAYHAEVKARLAVSNKLN